MFIANVANQTAMFENKSRFLAAKKLTKLSNNPKKYHIKYI